MANIRVLVIDDSAIVRDLLVRQLGILDGIEVVGAAPDAYVAREMIVELEPDVLTLDIEMPKMDGLTFLKNLMKSYPLPVIIVSSLVKGQNELSMAAFNLGAVDIVPKPGGPFSVGGVISLLGEKIRTASAVNLSTLKNNLKWKQTTILAQNVLQKVETTSKLVCIGTSTGGTIALEKILSILPIHIPPILVVIHMPEGFTQSFAQRLDELSACRVKEAKNGEIIVPGTVYIAPGNYHMTLRSSGTRLKLNTEMGPKVNSCRPSVDVLFSSVSRTMGRNCLGIILTGMGRDGASGLMELKEAGAKTVAQDERSCIVFGMPKEAIQIGAAMEVLPLSDIPDKIAGYFS